MRLLLLTAALEGRSVSFDLMLFGETMTQLSRADAARFLTEKGLPIAATTLAKKAVQGSGPPYRVWNGRATYSVDDLLKWVEAQLGPKLMSTAQRKVVRAGSGRA
jgi:hypothetical protein